MNFKTHQTGSFASLKMTSNWGSINLILNLKIFQRSSGLADGVSNQTPIRGDCTAIGVPNIPKIINNYATITQKRTIRPLQHT
jgi:hypothetical protein